MFIPKFSVLKTTKWKCELNITTQPVNTTILFATSPFGSEMDYCINYRRLLRDKLGEHLEIIDYFFE